MADPVVGAFVSGLVKAILHKLSSPAFLQIEQIFGVKNELKRLANTLSAINSVLLDAEEQQTALDSVRSWLQNLKDVAYDIEDVLDLVSTQDLEKRVGGRSLAQKVCALFSYYSLARKLKSICDKLDEIETNQRNFNFKECPRQCVDTDKERDTHSFVQESHVFGREEDKELIITRLLSSSSREVEEIPVLPIVGIGGIGKTTLAKLVFNDSQIQATANFELKLWAYVPNKYDMKTTIENIIQSATGETSSSNLNMEAIRSKLHRILAARAFLLVLDNVLIEDSKEWLDLKGLLEVGSKRSRLVITTREDRVASMAGTMEAYKLKPLSNDQCWSIFVKYAFREGEERAYPILVRIGKDIVRKCRGVPLAAKTLGSQLWTTRNESTWREIEESELWKIKQAPSDILPALKMSFDKLPNHIKPCFAFCSTYQKGQFMSRQVVVLLWMALGLLQPSEINGALEDIGNRHFDELIARSFFEALHPFTYTVRVLAWNSNMSEADMAIQLKEIDPALCYEPSYEKIIGVQMHDLIRDVAMQVAAEETAFIGGDKYDVSTRVRYLVWKEEDLSERTFPRQLLTATKARSLMFRRGKSGCVSKSFLQEVISNFRCLRILSLFGFKFEELPNSIGGLKHLRYLCLAENPTLKGLPDSICNLVNLQMLDVLHCEQLVQFPTDLHRLLSLRHLFFTSNLASLQEIGFHGWTSIQQILINSCLHLTSLPEQIGSLTTLRILRISNCPNLASLPNRIRHLTALEELKLDACEKLNLTGWEGLYGLRSLRYLHFQKLPLLVHFPDGLQYISGSLQHLIIKYCQNLTALPECLQHCTCLLKLTLCECSCLSTLPTGIQAIKNMRQLWISNCPKLNPRCERDKGDYWHLISHIPIIQIDHCYILNQ